jgi:hypothetical protein
VLNLIGILLISVAVGSFALGAVYHFFIRPVVRIQFGEESRRDYEAIRRRKEFEHRCLNALGGIYSAGVAGVVRGILLVTMPNIAVWALVAQLGALGVAGLCAWAAIVRWREPFEG